ncbi:MFS transporter [Streptomyces sp. b94]|uniref:MFS transporter n=1 Tax=Streptomyces sp. b94 TaxID=1827634 RepID=UPI001B37A2DB|nr:MFS transporter [Streptomyces sp. b94]MBQ1098276.1 MFS transporter [Streptomyces sp. b94]
MRDSSAPKSEIVSKAGVQDGSGQERGAVRKLLYSEAVSAFGGGLWFSMWAVYLTSVKGIPAASMGLAMGLGGGAGLLAAVPVGALADRHGARQVFVSVSLARGLLVLLFLTTNGFWSLLVAAALFTAAETSGRGVKVTLVYLLMPDHRRLTVLAQARVVQHITYAAGAGAAAWVLSTDTAGPYYAALTTVAFSAFLSAAVLIGLPPTPAVPAARRSSGTRAVRDIPFLTLMSTTALLSLCWPLLSSGLPLWLQYQTAAPVWLAPVAVVISSLFIALYQVRVTRQGESLRGAVRSTRKAGIALAACCLLLAAAAWPADALLSSLVVLAGLGAHIYGELHYVASRWGLSLRLMRRDAEGEYQGVAASTEGAVATVGPAMITTLVTGALVGGWAVLAVIFVVAAAPTPTLCRRALRARRAGVSTGPAPREESGR